MNQKNKKKYKLLKGQITYKLLELIEERTDNMVDVFFAYLNSNKRSPSSFFYELDKINTHPKTNKAYYKQKFDRLVYRLKKDGLIETQQGNFILTVLGRKKLRKLKISLSKIIPSRLYKKELDNHLKIVSFDIPEKFKKCREWLREALKRLDFTMVHKSLWMGKIKIPEGLIEDIHRLKIEPYIKIFSIDKKGNLEDLI